MYTRSAEKGTALETEMFYPLFKNTHRAVEFFTETFHAEKLSCAPVDKLFGKADLVLGERFSAGLALCHYYLSMTLAL